MFTTVKFSLFFGKKWKFGCEKVDKMKQFTLLDSRPREGKCLFTRLKNFL